MVKKPHFAAALCDNGYTQIILLRGGTVCLLSNQSNQFLQITETSMVEQEEANSGGTICLSAL
jgi:hypothetical protein